MHAHLRALSHVANSDPKARKKNPTKVPHNEGESSRLKLTLERTPLMFFGEQALEQKQQQGSIIVEVLKMYAKKSKVRGLRP